jgi:hypothetical protein
VYTKSLSRGFLFIVFATVAAPRVVGLWLRFGRRACNGRGSR